MLSLRRGVNHFIAITVFSSASKKRLVSFAKAAAFDVPVYLQLCVWVRICVYVSHLIGAEHDPGAA